MSMANKQKRPVEGVLFDWDGTLINSYDADASAYLAMFKEMGIRWVVKEFEKNYSPNWYHTFRCVGLPEAQWADADRLWLEHFANEHPQLIDGVEGALARIHGDGVVAAVVTSGTRSRIDREIVALGVDRYFADVICGDDEGSILQEEEQPDGLQGGDSGLGQAAVEVVDQDDQRDTKFVEGLLERVA